MPADAAVRTGSIAELVDALILFDGPMLDRRFSGMLERFPHSEERAALERVPELVVRGAKLTARGGYTWDAFDPTRALADAFVHRAERTLLRAFLYAAEEQAALKAFLSRNAPTNEIRRDIDAALAIHREVIETLRHALDRLGGEEDPEAPFVSVEREADDLRGDVERAVRRMRAEGRTPDRVVLSHTALRRLRDQGCFRDGDVLEGVPVVVDMAWEAPTFAVLSKDVVTVADMRSA